VSRYDLASAGGPQKYGIGLKELWQISDEFFSPGLVQHSFGWPLSKGASGGSFLYHYGERLVSVGFVVHLNYDNPTLSPFDEFQRFKSHPMVREMFLNGKRIAYGARAIASGGWQSVPKLVFPGGAFIGCSAGFVNFARIKGSHNAILSGILAAEKARAALAQGRANDELSDYEESWRDSDIGRDLYKVRNVKPLWSRFGLALGVGLGGFDMWTNELFKASIFGTLRYDKPDSDTLKPISKVVPISYPKPDSTLTFDKLSSVYLSNTNHEEDQPIHLRLRDPDIPIRDNLPRYGEPARLYCPAGVYEVVYTNEASRSDPRFVINAQNCVHCKTCDIKDPARNIEWVPPEGGGGPNYMDM
jgi:electron-transferring-flavoprotein dehydrogenase